MAEVERTKTAVPSKDETEADPVDVDTLAPGELLPEGTRLGRYEILFPLAGGGMGTVYVGRLVGMHGFDRLVAIKVLKRDAGDRASVRAFLEEAKLTARIHHPNVVETFELGEEDGSPFIVMQLVQGTSLSKLKHRLASAGEHFDVGMATWIVCQAAAGLHAAHELTDGDGEPLGVVHRDVSPQNILLSYDGRVYVADFGIAKLEQGGHRTTSGVVKGKFAYMSPEQAEARSVDRRSDVFSLGTVLYEALTGERLFASGSPAATLLKVVTHAAPPLRDVRPAVPESIAEIARRCLEKDPEDRYATAGEVRTALRRAMRELDDRVDESDLTGLLERHFGTERDLLRSRVRDATTNPGVRVPEGTESAHTLHPRGKKPGGLGVPVIVGAAGLVLGGILVTTLRGDPDPQPVPAEPTAAATQSPSASPDPTPAPKPEAPAPARTHDAAASSAADAGASARPQPPSPAPVERLPRPMRPRPKSPAPPAKPPESGPKPFTDLGL